MHALIILNNSIRLKDNQLLMKASESYKKVYLVYLVSEEIIGKKTNVFDWHIRAVKGLNANTNIVDIDKFDLQTFCEECSIKDIYVNRFYGSEKKILNDNLLDIENANLHICNDFNLFDYDKVRNKSGDYYKVYTPFWKYVSEMGVESSCGSSYLNKIEFLQCDNFNSEKYSIEKAKYEINEEPTEEFAVNKFMKYLEGGMQKYDETRNNLDGESSVSNMSQYINAGLISIKFIWHKAEDAHKTSSVKGYQVYMKELCWREFSYYLLYQFPNLPTDNFNSKFDKFAWGNKEEYIEAWKNGETGYDIVDAAMKEINATGLMHNRARMIVASFLIKNLNVDWRIGENYFREKLIDYSEASNSASWQWVAGSGADAAPYFRIFNPELQAAKFDSSMKYRDRYLGGFKLNNKIVDLYESRDRALKLFENIKE